MANRVTFSIHVVDRVSGKLDRMVNKWGKTLDKNLGPNSKQKGSIGAALFGTLGSAAIAGGIAAIGAALAVAAGSALYLTNALGSAARAQTMMIASASDVAVNMGISQKDGQDLYQRIEAQLARDAAALPGNTQDYGAVFNGIAPSISRVLAGDESAFERVSADIAKRTGVLATVRGADPTMAGSAINRAISGTSGLGELRQIDIFQKSGAFQLAIEDGLAAMGATADQWKELTGEQRLKIIQDALKRATPDAMLAEFEGTAEAVLQGWRSAIFEPLTGLLGVRRKVAAMNDRSALDAFADLLGNIQNLIDRVGGAMGRAGFNVDPMELVIKFFDWLGLRTNDLWRAVDRFETDGWAMVRDLPMIWAAYRTSDAIGKALADGTIWLVKNIPWGTLAQLVGKGVINSIMIGPQILFSTIERLAQRFVQAVQGQMDKLLAWADNIGEPLRRGFQDVIQRLVQRVRETFDALGRELRQWVSSMLPGFMQPASAPVTSGTSGRTPLARPGTTNSRSTTNNLQVSMSGYNLADPASNADVLVSAINNLFNERAAATL